MFEVCELTDIVDGVEPEPSPGAAREVWKKKNSVAKSFLLKSVSKDIIPRIVHYEKVSEIWEYLKMEYSQTGSGSVMMWFHSLTEHLSSNDEIPDHINHFQEAIQIGRAHV